MSADTSKNINELARLAFEAAYPLRADRPEWTTNEEQRWIEVIAAILPSVENYVRESDRPKTGRSSGGDELFGYDSSWGRMLQDLPGLTTTTRQNTATPVALTPEQEKTRRDTFLQSLRAEELYKSQLAVQQFAQTSGTPAQQVAQAFQGLTSSKAWVDEIGDKYVYAKPGDDAPDNEDMVHVYEFGNPKPVQVFRTKDAELAAQKKALKEEVDSPEIHVSSDVRPYDHVISKTVKEILANGLRKKYQGGRR